MVAGPIYGGFCMQNKYAAFLGKLAIQSELEGLNRFGKLISLANLMCIHMVNLIHFGGKCAMILMGIELISNSSSWFLGKY